jgi:AcrR family transcriptional regulator
MAWNTDATKRRLKKAATEEFAARGLDGTTMDRIAKRAGINKERLYNYFGEYAGRLFDYHTAHPNLIRLLHWEALAYGSRRVPEERSCTARYREKVAALAAAPGRGRSCPNRPPTTCSSWSSRWPPGGRRSRRLPGW